MDALMEYADGLGLEIGVEVSAAGYWVVSVAGRQLSRPIYLGTLMQAYARVDVWTSEQAA